MVTDISPGCFAGVFSGKTVLLTGHTGFKGSWTSLWLTALGARVVGYSLDIPTSPSLFETARVAEVMTHVQGDVRDLDHLLTVMRAHSPDIVMHYAAQPLVRLSYREPVETFTANVIGTVNVMEAIRRQGGVKACLIVTSDKCYENREWVYAYRENDPMGGYDPYSASKGAAEIAVASYRRSFFHPDDLDRHGVCLASVRAGNVIGGGDWSEDRILPDCIRALTAGQPIPVRNPGAIRPWQHVLEPLSGYLWLTASMCSGQERGRWAEAWNFGPHGAGNVTVRDIVTQVVAEWGQGAWNDLSGGSANAPHEATFLKLDCTKAANLLPWEPVLSVPESILDTMSWYKRHHDEPGADMRAFTLGQIAAYTSRARAKGLAWSA